MTNEQCPLYYTCRNAKELQYERDLDQLLSGAPISLQPPIETIVSPDTQDADTQRLIGALNQHVIDSQKVIDESLSAIAVNDLLHKKIFDKSIERDGDTCPGPKVTRPFRLFGKKTIECSSPARIERAKLAQEIIDGA